MLLVVFGAFKCVCVAKAERACLWCGLHRRRVVVCGIGGRCLCLVGCPFVIGVCAVVVMCVVSCLCAIVRCSLLGRHSLVRCTRSLSLLVLAEVRFPQNCVVLDYFTLVSVVAVLPQNLRCAVGLAGAFWFFPGSPFVASGGGSSQECSVFILGHRCVAPVIRSVPFGWAVFWRDSPRTALGAFAGGVVRLAMRLAAALVSSPCCSFPSFSATLVGQCVPVARMVCFISRTLCALPDGGLVSAVGVFLAVLLMEASVLHCGCAALLPSGGVIFPSIVFGLSWLLPSYRRFLVAPVALLCTGFLAWLARASVSPVCARLCLGLESLWLLLPMRQSRCSVFCVLLGADVVVTLLAGAGMACCALLGLQFLACGFLRVFGEESFLLARVVSTAGAPAFVRRFTSLLGVGGIELSAFGTRASLSLVVVPLLLWGGFFALSSCAEAGRGAQRQKDRGDLGLAVRWCTVEWARAKLGLLCDGGARCVKAGAGACDGDAQQLDGHADLRRVAGGGDRATQQSWMAGHVRLAVRSGGGKKAWRDE
ncbi:hypothetical protein Taro_055837 [Colocasia esculenta]|uniref:Uncharacterized protein n=1 Tax=Colocasia esculenta TaxID=4460 RepID=A0A843XSE3_COLES|nr:hypothetical protein [Colocasia esculenta]